VSYLAGTDIRHYYRKQIWDSQTIVSYSRSLNRHIHLDIGAGAGAQIKKPSPIDILNSDQYFLFQKYFPDKKYFFSILSISLYDRRYIKYENLNVFYLSEFFPRGLFWEWTQKAGRGLYKHAQENIQDNSVSEEATLLEEMVIQFSHPCTDNSSWQLRIEHFSRNFPGKGFDSSVDLLHSATVHLFVKNFFDGTFIILGRLLSANQTYYADAVNSAALLRGYLFNEFSSSLLVSSILEYRSHPLRFWYFALGWVVFGEYHSLNQNLQNNILRSVGLGLRIMLPDISYAIFWVDLSYPLDRSDHISDRLLSFGLNQQF